MDERLPEEFRDLVKYQIAFRQTQLAHLKLLYHDQFPSPSLLVVHGPRETYKSETLRHHLDEEGLDYAFVDCTECLSQRHLLARTFAQCIKKLGKQDELERYDRIDSINALSSNLKRLLDGRHERLLLVLAGIDEQKGASHTLLPALARLGERISCLCIILTSSSPRSLPLHKPGIPYVHFPAYTRSELVRLVVHDGPPSILDLSSHSASIQELVQTNVQSLEQIYKQFVTTIYDTLIAPTTSSLAVFQRTCHRLWPQFIWPLLIDAPTRGTTNKPKWDFAKLLSRNRALFQADGEAALQDRLLEDEEHAWSFEQVAHQYIEAEQLKAQSTTQEEAHSATRPDMTLTPSRRLRLEAAQKQQQQEKQKQQQQEESTTNPPLLKFLPTLILLAAYLASHTPSKHDIILFSRLSTASSTSRRKRRYLNKSRSGGISQPATRSPRKRKHQNGTDDSDDENEDLDPSTPSKKRLTNAELGINGTQTPTASTPKKERTDKSTRAILDKTSSIARAFPLERLPAILRAIHPHALPNHKSTADAIYAALAELERLRLVVRVSGSRERVGEIRRVTSGAAGEELMEEKWRCSVSREFVVDIGRGYGLSLEGWEIE